MSTYNRQQERAMALAGLFQAANCVAKLAEQNGQHNEADFTIATESLFIFDPKDSLDVYGGDLRNLHQGLTLLSKLSDKGFSKDFGETVRYALSLLAVEKQLRKQPDMLNVISSRLKHAQFNQQNFSDNETQLTSSLSGLYQDTISTLKLRIQVTGNMQHLTQTAVSEWRNLPRRRSH